MVGEAPRRSLSEMNIHDRDHLHALQHNNNINHTPTEGGEFYTAIGTDGINNATILLQISCYPLRGKKGLLTKIF